MFHDRLTSTGNVWGSTPWFSWGMAVLVICCSKYLLVSSLEEHRNAGCSGSSSPIHCKSFPCSFLLTLCVTTYFCKKSLILQVDQLLKVITDGSTLRACTDQQKCLRASPLNVSLLSETASLHVAFVLPAPRRLFRGGNLLQYISPRCHLIVLFDRYSFWNPL